MRHRKRVLEGMAESLAAADIGDDGPRDGARDGARDDGPRDGPQRGIDGNHQDKAGEDLREGVARLQNELFLLATARAHRELLADRVAESAVVCGAVFGEESEARTLVRARDEKTVELMRIAQESQAVQEAVEALRAQSNQLRAEARVLYQQTVLSSSVASAAAAAAAAADSDAAGTASSTAGGPIPDELLEDLKRNNELNTIVKNVLLQIITGTGVDWAKDPALLDLVNNLQK